MKRAVVVVLISVLAGCQVGGDAQAGGTALSSDSAGVEIVTNLGPITSLPFRASSLSPDLELKGDEEAGVILFRVSAVTPLARGRIAVGVGGSGAVLIFDSGGTLVTAFGRQGDGPGEFRIIQAVLEMPGDSLAVYDLTSRRLTVFSADGTLARTVDLSERLPARGASRLHSLPEGFVLVGEGGLAGRRDPGTYRESAPSFSLDRDGTPVANYGDFPGLETVYGDGILGRLMFGSTIFSATRGERFIVGLADSPEVLEFNPSGVLIRIIRWPDHDREVTAARMAEFVEHSLDLVPEAQRAQMRTVMGSMPYAPKEPAYYDMVASDEGDLWIGDYPGPESTLPQASGPARRWTIIDSTGVLREVIETPPGFRLMAVAGERAFGVHIDSLGVETVRVYSHTAAGLPAR